MNETRRILDAYARARADDRACALATVTFVEGSSYRRVGARMLVADDGEWVGCVSGGCLERDLLRKAAWAMERGEPLLATYDTREDGDGAARTPGAGLGCNGVIEILLEPIRAGGSHAVLDLIAGCTAARRPGGVVLFPHEPTAAAITWDGDGPILPGTVPAGARQELIDAWQGIGRRSRAIGRDCGAEDERRRVFIESLRPTVRVAVIGAGYDAVAMAAMGVHLGYEVTVVDFRSALPIPRRAFAGIERYVQCTPADLAATLPLDDRSVVILMTHQAKDDLAALPYLLESRPAYLGLLGPRKRAMRLLAECGRPDALEAENLHAPIGLDIGAETPAEIALAVFAEVQAAFAGRAGGSLRGLAGPIHARASA